jgi:uncharacterized membrane protein
VSRQEGEPPGRGRRVAVGSLLAVATLLAFLAIFSVWINRQALNTDNWVNTSDQLLQNTEVQEQLSAYMANELFANVEVEQELEGALPPRLAPLAGPATGGLHQLAPKIAERVLASSQFQTLWNEANRAAHEALLKVLNGGGNAVSTEGGEVKLKLGGMLEQVAGQLGIGGDVAEKLPADAGELTILRSEQLSTAQDVARLVRKLPIVLTVLAFGLFALAVFLARPRRREALRSVGIGFLVAGLLALIVRGIAGGYVVDALVRTESVRPAAEAVWSIGTSLLVTVAVSVLAFGILLILGAWLAGSTRPALALRREISPYVRESQAGTYGAAFVVFIALIAWAPIAAFHKPLGILVFALLLAAGTELLRRQVLAEFPHSERGELWQRLRARVSRDGGAAPTPAAAPAPEVASLERLADLHRGGELTDAEFAAAKAKLLGDVAQSPS